MSYDAIIVGGGHNGLICAAYLARAGLRVVVLERRTIVGGAVMTEELWPGYQVDTCSVLHIAIHTTPIIEELELARFGLRYLPADPWAFAPFEDGTTLFFYRDLEQTCQAISEACGERDAEAYHNFAREWIALAKPMYNLFLRPPTMKHVATAWSWRELPQLRAASRVGDVQEAMKPYGRVLEERFENPKLRATLAWLGAQAGAPPNEPGGAGQFIWLAMLHSVGAWHPVGGSGRLTQALASCVEHHGGTVRSGAEVKRILLANGEVTGVELADGERVAASLVVGAGHVQTMLLDLLPPGAIPVPLRRSVEALKVGPGIGMTLRASAKELPAYPSTDVDGTDVHEAYYGMQLYCPSIDYLDHAFHQASLGQPPDGPAVMAMTPSAYDRTIVPEGKQSIYFWAQWHPYALRNGEQWDAIAEQEAEKIVRAMSQVAPNLMHAIEWERVFIQTPKTLAERAGLRGGNIMHLDMSLDQMFNGRPLPELSDYRTPIRGLYLSGASTHPGGGVFGAPGHNSAHTILSDLTAQNRSSWTNRLVRRVTERLMG
ncbi:MAG: NAD(P)/FAD-dependent oxidoreductase [Chloroflexota bacterium]|nr:NAD(P)/FAD-dependent oxidoreductase [Chloroflexota bacterium]